jgi:hypothetical protein
MGAGEAAATAGAEAAGAPWDEGVAAGKACAEGAAVAAAAPGAATFGFGAM